MKNFLPLVLSLAVFAPGAFAAKLTKADVGTADKPPKCALPRGLAPMGKIVLPGPKRVMCAACAAGEGVGADGYCGRCDFELGILATGACGHCPPKTVVAKSGKCAPPPTEAEKAAERRKQCETTCDLRRERDDRACYAACAKP
jgi:hypothetical protein